MSVGCHVTAAFLNDSIAVRVKHFLTLQRSEYEILCV